MTGAEMIETIHNLTPFTDKPAQWVTLCEAHTRYSRVFSAAHSELILRGLLDNQLVPWRADEVDIDHERVIIEMRGVCVDWLTLAEWLDRFQHFGGDDLVSYLAGAHSRRLN